VDSIAFDRRVSEVKAARWWGPRQITLEEIPIPERGKSYALVRVLWVGLCGSDLEEFTDGPIVARPGVVLGHEIVGEVVEPARDGSGPTVGERVVVDVVLGCGHCYHCLRHEEGRCSALQVLGQTMDGGLAEFIAARASRLISIPEGVPSRKAALAEPLAVAVRAVRKVDHLLGQAVLVYGGGTIGMLVAQVARAAGASVVVVVEPSPSRRALIETWSITTLWHSDETLRISALAALAPSRGFDAVFEASGAHNVAKEAGCVTRAGGKLVLLGVPVAEQSLDLLDMVLGEKTFVGSAAHMWDDDVAAAIAMIHQGSVDVESIVTHTGRLDDISSAFETLSRGKDDVVKMLIDCTINGGGADEPGAMQREVDVQRTAETARDDGFFLDEASGASPDPGRQ